MHQLLLLILITFAWNLTSQANNNPPMAASRKGVKATLDNYSAINNTYDIDVSIRSKMIGIVVQNKLFDLSKSHLTKEIIEKNHHLVKNQWIEELEKKFTKTELDYLRTVLNHKLFTRLKEFQRDFRISKENEKIIIQQLKEK